MLAGMLPYLPFDGVLAWPYITSILGSGYFFVIAATLLTFVICGIALVVKYSPMVLHDLNTLTNKEMPQAGLKLWTVLLLIVPIFFNAGLIWFLLWWFILLWGYMHPSERRIAFTFTAIIFLASWLVHVGAAFLTYAQTQANREIFAVEHMIDTPRDAIELTVWSENNATDAPAINAKALLAIRKGNYAEATSLLEKCLDIEPHNARYYNHLGIALAEQDKNSMALKAFNNAINIEPQNALYHYNLSRLEQSLYHFYEAEKSIVTASKLDPARVREFLEHEELQPKNRFVVAQTPIFEQIKRQMRNSDPLNDAADKLWHILLGLISRGLIIPFVLIYALILFIESHLPSDKFSKRCSRCGRLHYVGSETGRSLPICLQCQWMNSRSERQLNQIVTDKMNDVRTFRQLSEKRAARLERILPGLGLFVENRITPALIRFSLFSVGLVLLISGGVFVQSFIQPEATFAHFGRALGLIIIIGTYWRAYVKPPALYGV